MAYIGAALQASGFLGLEQFSVLIAAGFLGMFAGTVVFGIGSDRFGRRTSFVLMLLSIRRSRSRARSRPTRPG